MIFQNKWTQSYVQIPEGRALGGTSVEEPGWLVLGAGPLLHGEVADVHPGCDGTSARPPRPRPLPAPILTELERVELVAVALTTAVVEGEACVGLIVVPELLHGTVAGSDHLWQLTDVLGGEAGGLAVLAGEEPVPVPLLSAVQELRHQPVICWSTALDFALESSG